MVAKGILTLCNSTLFSDTCVSDGLLAEEHQQRHDISLLYPWGTQISQLTKNKTKMCRKRFFPVRNLTEKIKQLSSVSPVSLWCPTFCDPMDHSTPGLPGHHQLPELAQTHVYWVSDAIELPHPLSSHSPPAFNLCQHQGLFRWVSSSHQVAKVLEFQLQHQSFQWTFRTDLL